MAAHNKTTPATAPVLFVAVQSAFVDEKINPKGAILKGEIAVDGAKILKTCGSLFKPLEITYHA